MTSQPEATTATAVVTGDDGSHRPEAPIHWYADSVAEKADAHPRNFSYAPRQPGTMASDVTGLLRAWSEGDGAPWST